MSLASSDGIAAVMMAAAATVTPDLAVEVSGVGDDKDNRADNNNRTGNELHHNELLVVAAAFSQQQQTSRQKFLDVLSVGVTAEMDADGLLELFVGSMFIEGADPSNPNSEAFLHVAGTIEDDDALRNKLKNIMVTALLRRKNAEQLLDLLRITMFLDGSRVGSGISIVPVGSAISADTPTTLVRVDRNLSIDFTHDRGAEGMTYPEPRAGDKRIWSDHQVTGDPCPAVNNAIRDEIQTKRRATDDCRHSDQLTRMVIEENVNSPCEVAVSVNGRAQQLVLDCHPREQCRLYPFTLANEDNKLHCPSCLCAVCGVPAKDCVHWTAHCNCRPSDEAVTRFEEIRRSSVYMSLSTRGKARLCGNFEDLSWLAYKSVELGKELQAALMRLQHKAAECMRYLKLELASKFQIRSRPDIFQTAIGVDIPEVLPSPVADVSAAVVDTTAASSALSVVETNMDTYLEIIGSVFEESYDSSYESQLRLDPAKDKTRESKQLQQDLEEIWRIPPDFISKYRDTFRASAPMARRDYLVDTDNEAILKEDVIIEAAIMLVVILRFRFDYICTADNPRMNLCPRWLVELLFLPFCTDDLVSFVCQRFAEPRGLSHKCLRKVAEAVKGENLWFRRALDVTSFTETNRARIEATQTIGNASGLQLPASVLLLNDMTAKIVVYDALMSLGVSPAPGIDFLISLNSTAVLERDFLKLALQICQSLYPTILMVLPTLLTVLSNVSVDSWDLDRLQTDLINDESGRYLFILGLLFLQAKSPQRLVVPLKFSVALFAKVLPKCGYTVKVLPEYLKALIQHIADPNVGGWDMILGFPSNGVERVHKLGRETYTLVAAWRYFDLVISLAPRGFCQEFRNPDLFEESETTRSLVKVLGAFNDVCRHRSTPGCNIIPLFTSVRWDTSAGFSAAHAQWSVYDAFDKFKSVCVYHVVRAVDVTAHLCGARQHLFASRSVHVNVASAPASSAFEQFPILERQHFWPTDVSISGLAARVGRFIDHAIYFDSDKQLALVCLKGLNSLFVIALHQGGSLLCSLMKTMWEVVSSLIYTERTVAKVLVQTTTFTFSYILYKISGFFMCCEERWQLRENVKLPRERPTSVAGLVALIRDCLKPLNSLKAYVLQPATPVAAPQCSIDEQELNSFPVIQPFCDKLDRVLHWPFWQGVMTRCYACCKDRSLWSAGEGLVIAAVNREQALFRNVTVRVAYAYEQQLSIADVLLLAPSWDPTPTSLRLFRDSAVEAFLGPDAFDDFCLLAMDLQDSRLLENIVAIVHFYHGSAVYRKYEASIKRAFLNMLIHPGTDEFVEAIVVYGLGIARIQSSSPEPSKPTSSLLDGSHENKMTSQQYAEYLALWLLDPNLVLYYFSDPRSEQEASYRTAVSKCLLDYSIAPANELILSPTIANNSRTADILLCNAVASSLRIRMADANCCKVIFDAIRRRSLILPKMTSRFDVMDTAPPNFDGTAPLARAVRASADTISLPTFVKLVLRCLGSDLAVLDTAVSLLNTFIAELLLISPETEMCADIRSAILYAVDPNAFLRSTSSSSSARSIAQEDFDATDVLVSSMDYHHITETFFYVSSHETRCMLLARFDPSPSQLDRISEWYELMYTNSRVEMLDYFDVALRFMSKSRLIALLRSDCSCTMPHEFPSAEQCLHSSRLYWKPKDQGVHILSTEFVTFACLLDHIQDTGIQADVRAVYFGWVMKKALEHPTSLHCDISQTQARSYIDTDLKAKAATNRQWMSAMADFIETNKRELQQGFQSIQKAEPSKLPNPVEATALLMMCLESGSVTPTIQQLNGSRWGKAYLTDIAKLAVSSYYDASIGVNALASVGELKMLLSFLSNSMNNQLAALHCLNMLIKDGVVGQLIQQCRRQQPSNESSSSFSLRASKRRRNGSAASIAPPPLDLLSVLVDSGFLRLLVTANVRCHHLNSAGAYGNQVYFLTALEQQLYEHTVAAIAPLDSTGVKSSFSLLATMRNYYQTIYGCELIQKFNCGDYYPAVDTDYARLLLQMYDDLVKHMTQDLCSDDHFAVCVIKLCTSMDVEAGEKLIRMHGSEGLKWIVTVLRLCHEVPKISNSVHYNLVLCYRLVALQDQYTQAAATVSHDCAEFVSLSKALAAKWMSEHGTLWCLIDSPASKFIEIEVANHVEQNVYTHFKLLYLTNIIANSKSTLFRAMSLPYFMYLMNYAFAYSNTEDWSYDHCCLKNGLLYELFALYAEESSCLRYFCHDVQRMIERDTYYDQDYEKVDKYMRHWHRYCKQALSSRLENSEIDAGEFRRLLDTWRSLVVWILAVCTDFVRENIPHYFVEYMMQILFANRKLSLQPQNDASASSSSSSASSSGQRTKKLFLSEAQSEHLDKLLCHQWVAPTMARVRTSASFLRFVTDPTCPHYQVILASSGIFIAENLLEVFAEEDVFLHSVGVSSLSIITEHFQRRGRQKTLLDDDKGAFFGLRDGAVRGCIALLNMESTAINEWMGRRLDRMECYWGKTNFYQKQQDAFTCYIKCLCIVFKSTINSLVKEMLMTHIGGLKSTLKAKKAALRIISAFESERWFKMK
jgi:hypothetical protein